MKKIVVLASILFLGYSASSQELGLRFGDVLGNNWVVRHSTGMWVLDLHC
jgi:hypothetical protein